jgi:prophage maintenance system killer protein
LMKLDQSEQESRNRKDGAFWMSPAIDLNLICNHAFNNKRNKRCSFWLQASVRMKFGGCEISECVGSSVSNFWWKNTS